MAGYIGSKTSVTQVDGYNRTEADDEFVNDPNSVITVSGSNVGIGTSSPSSLLDVDQSQNAETNIELTNTNTGSSAQVRTKYTTDGGLFTVGKTSDAHAFGGDAYLYNVDNTNIRFATNDTERMRIDGAGKVRTVAFDGGNTFEALELNNIANVSSAGTGVQLKFKLSQTQNAIESRKYAAIEGVSPVAWGEQVDLRFVTQPYASSNNVRETMRIDGHGRVTMPYQPAFSAHRTAGNIGTGNNTSYNFNVAVLNVGSHYNTANGRFTAPVAGHYMFTYHILKRQAGVAATYLRKNGGNTISAANTYTDNGSLTQEQTVGASHIIYMAASDYVEVRVDVTSGDFYGDGNSHNIFTGHLIG